MHGLNDENVSTKQFEMMYKSFKKAGQNVKLLLHQGYHMTPTMANKGYGFLIDGEAYDDILNRWYSHYLFGIDNDAWNMPSVIVQDNVDDNKWIKLDKWEPDKIEKINAGNEKFVIDTDYEKAGINKENYDEKMSLYSSNFNKRLSLLEAEDDLIIRGTTKISFEAALNEGDASNFFFGKNINDADKLSVETSNKSGHMEDVKMTVMLCDVCDEKFLSLHAKDPERNVIPHRIIKEKTIVNGNGQANFDEIAFERTNSNYKVISRSYIDLCNPESGYASETSKNSIELKKGEYNTYNVFLNAQHYKLEKGHKLILVLGTEDIVFCLMHKDYKIEIKENTVRCELPIGEK